MRLNKISFVIIITLFLSGCLTEFVEKDDIHKPADSVKDDVMEMRDDTSITPEDYGSEDDNVHSQHTTQFINKALRAKKEVVWHQYTGRNHGIYGGGARKDLYGKMIQFFRENL